MKKIIVISAVNFTSGGPFSVLVDCLVSINSNRLSFDNDIYAFVHKVDLFNSYNLENIKFIELPNIKGSYFNRIKFEYIDAKKWAKRLKVDLWISLHDMSPFLGKGVSQVVYCHNPSPFRDVNFGDIRKEPSLFLFSLFYKYLYRINIKSNKYVIVQQAWMKLAFSRMFNLQLEKIIVAKPDSKVSTEINLDMTVEKLEVNLFIFPTLPRVFKNIEVLCKAARLLVDKGVVNFCFVITIDGSENIYAKELVDKYSSLSQIKFVGRINRDEVYNFYQQSKALVFPSKLETWGLPLSEYKHFNKPILAADLPYAKETIGKYDKVKFFKPDDCDELSRYMFALINDELLLFDNTTTIDCPPPYAANWNELFDLIIKED